MNVFRDNYLVAGVELTKYIIFGYFLDNLE